MDAGGSTWPAGHSDDLAPDRRHEQRGERDPHPALEEAGAHPTADTRSDPEDADDRRTYGRREVAQRDVLVEPRQPEPADEDRDGVVARHAGHQRGEEEALDQELPRPRTGPAGARTPR
jgi:hypothetical protein